MPKVKLGLITASVAVLFATTGDSSESISATVILPPLDATNLNAGTEQLGVGGWTINSTRQLPGLASSIRRWTEIEQRRYKQLVVKFACSNLSEPEKHELEQLKVARAQFEDARSAEEIIAEFQTRQNYAALLSSLRKASIGTPHA
jgi:hypothetical protein